MKSKKKRTENGPRWESGNPGKGCNSTHVARSRRWWKKYANKTERRTGSTGPNWFKKKRKLPSIEREQANENETRN